MSEKSISTEKANASQPMNNTEKSVDPRQLVAGQILAQQREKLGLSVAECAESLKISASKVAALESGDDKPFVSEIFIRGYLKSYAKLLQLSEIEIIHSYDAQRHDNKLAEDTHWENTHNKTSRWWLPYVLGVIIIGIWFVVSHYWGVSGFTSRSISETSSVIIEPITDIKRADAQALLEEKKTIQDAPQMDGAVINDVLLESPVAPSDSEVETKTQESGTRKVDAPSESTGNKQSLSGNEITSGLTQQESVAPNTIALVKDRLYFTFSQACWVEIVDATDQTIVSSLRKENSDLLVEGIAPFSIVLGNISGTTLRFNDELVSLANSRDGRTLRLTVGG
jgi:cytoskeleton protein RodZ